MMSMNWQTHLGQHIPLLNTYLCDIPIKHSAMSVRLSHLSTIISAKVSYQLACHIYQIFISVSLISPSLSYQPCSLSYLPVCHIFQSVISTIKYICQSVIIIHHIHHICQSVISACHINLLHQPAALYASVCLTTLPL